MSFVSEWYETTKSVLRSPTEHFRMETRSDGFDYPLRYALFSYIIAGIISAILTGVITSTAPAGSNAVATAFAVLVTVPIGGIIGLAIGALLVHIVVYLMGGRGYRKTFAAAAYTTALAPITAVLGFIPVLGGLVGLLAAIYGLFIYIRALENFHDFTGTKAAIAVLLPAVVLFLIALIGALLFASLAVLSVLG